MKDDEQFKHLVNMWVQGIGIALYLMLTANIFYWGDSVKKIDWVDVYGYVLIVIGFIIVVGGAIEIYGGWWNEKREL